LWLAYTFQEHEFEILESVLKGSLFSTDFVTIGKDSSGRRGRQYRLPPLRLSLLEGMLGGSFNTKGNFIPATAGPGSTYACREKKLGGRDGKGCQEFSAADDQAAFVACSLIAGSRGWYFGKHHPGTCGAKESWFSR
jgi:hypothetical protein